MAYYKQRLTASDLTQSITKFRNEFLVGYCKAIIDPDMGEYADELSGEWYFMPLDIDPFVYSKYVNLANVLARCAAIKKIPVDDGIIYIIAHQDNPQMPTVSPTYVRLPDIRILSTLTPEDFFRFIRLISNAKHASPDSLSIDFAAEGVTYLPSEAFGHFFQQLKTNYRLDPNFADLVWTRFDLLPTIANLEPTRENHFSAIQFLSAIQCDNAICCPIDTVLDLELDWPQVNDDYCQPDPKANSCKNRVRP